MDAEEEKPARPTPRESGLSLLHGLPVEIRQSRIESRAYKRCEPLVTLSLPRRPAGRKPPAEDRVEGRPSRIEWWACEMDAEEEKPARPTPRETGLSLLRQPTGWGPPVENRVLGVGDGY